MPQLLLGLLLLITVVYGLRLFANTPPRLLARVVRTGGGVAALGAAAFLMLRGRFDMGLALGSFGLWLMGIFKVPGGGAFRTVGRGKRADGMSRVRSAMIEMELDHASGAMHGSILAGPLEGRLLDSLTRPECENLHRVCLDDDPDGARLLEAYLDRRFPRWREAGERERDSRGGSTSDVRARRAGAMSEDEAYEVLGLGKGATRDDISRSHRTLMKKFHPDHGGTTDLAARLNEAKDTLLRRHG